MSLAPLPLRLEAPRAGELGKLIRAALDEKGQGQGRRLRCSACGHVVSDESQRTDVGGGHEHTLTNPHGFTYHIGCFRAAPGCRQIGQGTFEHTWFPGYAWEISLCAGCGAHLGWRFRGAPGGFYGLILARLVADQ